MTILNTEILGHPMNWITVFLMVFVFAVALNLITDYHGILTAPRAG